MRVIIEFFMLLVTAALETLSPWFLPQKRKDISKDVVLITGAAHGLGRELALEFYKQNATIVLMDVNKHGLEETKQYLMSLFKATNGISLYQCDVSQYERVKESFDKIRRDIGDVSILVNNAGVVSTKGLLETTPEQFERTVSVNLIAHAWTVKCCLPSMISKGKGHVVTIASLLGLVACNKIGDYCASKFGAVGFHESLSSDLMVLNKKGMRLVR